MNRSFLSHEKSKYWSVKNNLTPRQVPKHSNKCFYFDCEECGHELYCRLGNITKNSSWCVFCANKKICANLDCEICEEKSFKNHEKSKFWSDSNAKTPRDVIQFSKNKYKFECEECCHTFDASLDHVAQGKWCPYCSNKKLCTDENCAVCEGKSFMGCINAEYWSNKNTLSPRLVLKTSQKKFLFNCADCEHEFYISPYNVILQHWCSYCSNKQLCDNINCLTCKEKSFAVNEHSKYWSDKNIVSPRQVFKGTDKKYIFKCEDCNNEFNACPNSITTPNRFSWCPYCINKTEKKLYAYLKIKYPNVKHQYKADWCRNKKTNRYLPFDFMIESLNIIIELDGIQHFKQVAKWKSPNDTQKTDIYKMQLANTNGFTILRILQEDIYYDKYDWQSALDDKITTYNKPDNIFICVNDEYNVYKEKICVR